MDCAAAARRQTAGRRSYVAHSECLDGADCLCATRHRQRQRHLLLTIGGLTVPDEHAGSMGVAGEPRQWLRLPGLLRKNDFRKYDFRNL